MSDPPSPFLSVRACVLLSVAAGMLGLVLMHVVPVSTNNEYLRRFETWAREVKASFDACGKHEPRDPECVRHHPIPERP
jgi:hypothetical protein